MTVIPGIRVLKDRYSAWLCDVWGVLHNGRAPFPGAVDALSTFRREGGRVVMITNAPRPAATIERQFRQLGVPTEAYDAIVTSGDAARDWLQRLGPQPIYHLGPQRDLPLIEGLDLNLVGPDDEPAVVLCTGLFDDETETPEDYRGQLEAHARRGATLMCANPDIVVDRAGKLVYCAGALARLYDELGGAVVYAGKPHKPIYDLAFTRLGEITGRDYARSEVLAIGDGMPTDIAGARALGIDTVFVAGGIHAEDIVDGDGTIDADRLRAFLDRSEARPVAVQWDLSW